MNSCKVAVIGATGAVGQVFLKIAEERKFPMDALSSVPLRGRWVKN